MHTLRRHFLWQYCIALTRYGCSGDFQCACWSKTCLLAIAAWQAWDLATSVASPAIFCDTVDLDYFVRTIALLRVAMPTWALTDIPTCRGKSFVAHLVQIVGSYASALRQLLVTTDSVNWDCSAAGDNSPDVDLASDATQEPLLDDNRITITSSKGVDIGAVPIVIADDRLPNCWSEKAAMAPGNCSPRSF